MKSTRVYLIRHGQVVGFEQLRFNGWTDVDLTDIGRAQLDAVAEDLSRVELAAVYSSDLKRARYGGEALAKTRKLELKVEPAFRELFFGDWEGLNFKEVDELFPGAMEGRMRDIVNYRPPNGETVGELHERVGAGLRKAVAENQGQALAVVAHSAANRAMLLQAMGCPPDLIWRLDQSFGCLNIVDFFLDGFTVIRQVNGSNRVGGPFF
ncbi:MAG: histidine phosphatase family protein [Pseudomonadota bacterium]